MTPRLWFFALLAAVFLVAALITHSPHTSYDVMMDFGLSIAGAFLAFNIVDGFVELRNRRRNAEANEDKEP